MNDMISLIFLISFDTLCIHILLKMIKELDILLRKYIQRLK